MVEAECCSNQVADMPAGQEPESADVPLQSYTEFAVEWRGVHLDSFLVHYWHDGVIPPQDVEQIILRWSEHANRNHIFSTPFPKKTHPLIFSDSKKNYHNAVESFEMH